MGNPIEYKKIEMNISWILTGKEKFEEVSKTSWIVKGKNNVPGFIAKNIFCDIYDENVKDAYFRILTQCNGIIDSNENKSLKYKSRSFTVSDAKWADERFTAFENLINTDTVLSNKIRIYDLPDNKDKYQEQMAEYKSKKNPGNAIPSEENTPSGENAKKQHKEESLKIALLVGEPKNDDEIKKLKAEILDGIRDDWCTKLQFCQSLKFTDKKGMPVNLSRKSIVDSLVENDAFFPQTIRGILERRYDTMGRICLEKHSEKDWKDEEENLNIEDLNVFPDALLGIPENYFTSDFWRNFFTKYNNIGHDMPVWLYYENITEFPKLEDRPRVMIVSQDPLRNNHNENKVYLSTPFGFHSLAYLQTKDDETKKSMVRMFVHLYLRQGYIVYLTDVMKLFGYDRASSKKLNELKKEELHKTTYNTVLKKSTEILKNEIKDFNPNFIIALGNQTATALTGYWNEEKDHRNMCVPLLDELCPDSQNKISVYVRYHTGAHASDNLHHNDPEYWYVKPK